MHERTWKLLLISSPPNPEITLVPKLYGSTFAIATSLLTQLFSTGFAIATPLLTQLVSIGFAGQSSTSDISRLAHHCSSSILFDSRSSSFSFGKKYVCCKPNMSFNCVLHLSKRGHQVCMRCVLISCKCPHNEMLATRFNFWCRFYDNSLRLSGCRI